MKTHCMGLVPWTPDRAKELDPCPYELYHQVSMEAGDVDPSYSMLRYLCERFELNIEQRYWLAFLYATCYCGPTVFYIYNEFPDFENVDEGRLERWWAGNKSKLYFQTDRRWIRSRNQFCDIFRSYRAKVGKRTQAEMFASWETENEFLNYDRSWKQMESIYQFGRFALFLYLEAVHVVTDYPMRPRGMDLSTAESCRNGLAYALGMEQRLNTHDGARGPLKPEESSFLQREFNKLVVRMEAADARNNVWNIETTLCAYKKYRMGKRHVGYYLDRQADEIEKMQEAVKWGVDWSVLWQYRHETFNKTMLREVK